MPLPRIVALSFLSVMGCAGDPVGATDPDASGADSGADSGAAGPPATAHWMADVFTDRPDTPLGTVLLPGAFNSSSYACEMEHGISPDSPEAVLILWGPNETGNEAYRQRIVDWSKTQTLTIEEQLDAGIRFIEINLTMRDGELVTWHSVYGVPVGEVLDQVVAWSAAWPDEVVLLSFGLGSDEADREAFAEAMTAPRTDGLSVCDRVYDGPEDAAIASLGDIRDAGRNIVWAPGGDLRTFIEARGDCPMSSGGTDRSWSLTVSPDGVEEALAASVDSRDPGRLLINDFVFSLGASETGLEQAQYIAEYPGMRAASVDLGFAGDFPTRLVETYDTAGNMNVFAGAFVQDSTLVEAAIARNQER